MNKSILGLGIAICILGVLIANYYSEYKEWECRAWKRNPTTGKLEPEPGPIQPPNWVLVTKRIYPYFIVGLIVLLIGSVTIFVGCFMPTEPKTNIIICPRCGSRNTANSKFCVRCGSRLEVAKDED